ncbi:hypothetical protein [Sediminitomix flava]|nr:hypothetical protein [Sediminitomix flava]
MKKTLTLISLLFVAFTFSSCDELLDEVNCVSLVAEYNKLIETPEEDIDCDMLTELYDIIKEGKECDEFMQLAEDEGYSSVDAMLEEVELAKAIICTFAQ